MNAGLAMKCTVAAVRCVITETGGIELDPCERRVLSGDERKLARADFTFAFDSVEKRSISCYATGLYSPDELQEAMSAAQAASEKVFLFYKTSFRKFTKLL